MRTSDAPASQRVAKDGGGLRGLSAGNNALGIAGVAA